ncbi:MAG: hypothetical protein GF411_19505 [Candidatus Lokiarchaeota archaeon]|nr:hypothetical protein [Candidatus Lokiarchaeota archaeon]
MTAYNKLMSLIKEIYVLNSAAGIIQWDQETYMPPKGIRLRSEQLSLLGMLAHRKMTSTQLGQYLDEAMKNFDDFDEVEKRNLILFKKEYDIQTVIPEELVGQIAKQRVVSVETWKKAKAANDWKMFQPELEKMVELSVKRAELTMDVIEASTPYNAMIDTFEPKMTADAIDKVFSELRDGLVPLTKKYSDISAEIDDSFLSRIVPIEKQRIMATELANIAGYDTTSDEAGGRIDEVEHPFTTGYYDDVRITVKYHPENVSSMIYAILHEAGHALYEQNLNSDWMFQPIGSASSYGVHESQSRFLENMIGRSPEFLQYYLPQFRNQTGGLFADVKDDLLLQSFNLVKPSLIRIEADEVTYSLHVIIRFEIEKALFSGKIDIGDLPQFWNEKYEEYLGVQVPNDSRGVMQDTHWASGYYGYFPSYALGNVFDGMWLSALNKDVPDWRESVKEGKLNPAMDWMKKNVHHHSNMYDPLDLVKVVTGSEMSAKPFLKYLENKFEKIF